MGLFGPSTRKVLKMCRELSKELNTLPYQLNRLEKAKPKKHKEIKLRLRDLVEDIGEALKDISLPGNVVDELVDSRRKFGNLREKFFH